MKGEREIDNFLSEKSHNYHQKMMLNGVVSGTSSCSSSNGVCFPDVGSSSIPSFDHSQFYSLSDSWYGRVNNGVLPDELGLAREFGRMNMGNRISSNFGGLERETEGFRTCDYYNVPKIRPSNGQNYGSSEGSANGFSGNGGFLNIKVGNVESIVAQNQSSIPYSGNGNGNRNCSIDFPFEETNPPQSDDSYGNFLPILGGNRCYDNGIPMNRTNDYPGNGGLIQRGDGAYNHLIPFQVQSMYGPQIAGDPCSQNLSMYRPYSGEGILPQCGVHFCENMGALNTMDSSQLVHYRQTLSRGNKLYNSTREKIRAAEERESSQSVSLMKRGAQFATYGCENAFLLKEKGMTGVLGKSCQSPGRVKTTLNGQLQSERNGSHLMSCDPMISQSILTSMAEVQGNIYFMAKDQNGCRFLQKKFDKGSFEDVQLIFNEIIDHVVELMMNPFGNYLIQKLLDVCNEEQRMRILHAVTKDRGELVRICLNTHGTRVVQKLIEGLQTKKQISVVVRALEPGFLDLIKDLNGNHVVQRCLQCLSSEDTKFIFDAAAKFCVEIATHRHGCCVLQRCIAHSSGEHQKKLVEEICGNGLNLAQDPFGNYVVQYIIELKIPTAAVQLTSQFDGHYIHLATQKFSSHVVEKCLKYIEDSRPRIVYELLSVSHFEQLLQDPFANYVIQSALEVTKGAVNDSLVAAVRPHSMLRTNPYCKKIFTRGMLKK